MLLQNLQRQTVVLRGGFGRLVVGILHQPGFAAALGGHPAELAGLVHAVEGILEPEIHRLDVLKLPQGRFQPPGGGAAVAHVVFHMVRELQLDHV